MQEDLTLSEAVLVFYLAAVAAFAPHLGEVQRQNRRKTETKAATPISMTAKAVR